MAIAKGKKEMNAAGFVNNIMIVDKNGVEHQVPRDAVCIVIRDEKLANMLNGKHVVLKGTAAIPQDKPEPDYSSIEL